MEIAQAADEAGFSSLWFMDHFYQIGHGYGPADAPMLEGYTTLSYLASVTRNLRLGLEVTGNPYRHPGVLVKMVTTLDILSGGRANLGIGAGWYRYEARGLGVPWPETLGERFDRLEETLRIAHHMWSDDRSSFEDKYHRLEEPICSPQPLTKPHPPIMIGGDGERRTLRLVAEYGDACNLSLGSPLKQFTERHNENYRTRRERLTRKAGKLREYCLRAGRDPEEIECTVHGPIIIGPDALTPDNVVEMCVELAEMGFSQYIFNIRNVHEIEPLAVIGEEVIPQVRDI